MTQAQAVAQIQIQLFSLQDQSYRDFHSKLMPTIPKYQVIGIRTPQLRKFAKELFGTPEAALFMEALPHRYYEENNLQMMLISQMKEYQPCIRALEEFLPYIDNWATCDLPSPKCFEKNKEDLLPRACGWLLSEHPYTVRYGIGTLMRLFLDEDFKPEFLQRVAVVRSREYYVNMMVAWYFATALAKQWEAALPYLTGKALDPWTHNKTIQKAVESGRITPAQKEQLKQLRIR